MSEPTGVDARGYLAAWAGIMADMTSKDIAAIPANKWNEAYGGCLKALADVSRHSGNTGKQGDTLE